MIRRPPRSTLDRSSAASDVYKRQDVILVIQTDDPNQPEIEVKLIGEKIIENLLYIGEFYDCLLYTSPSPRDRTRSRMPSSA